jgi:hypothetical protein
MIAPVLPRFRMNIFRDLAPNNKWSSLEIPEEYYEFISLY